MEERKLRRLFLSLSDREVDRLTREAAAAGYLAIQDMIEDFIRDLLETRGSGDKQARAWYEVSARDETAAGFTAWAAWDSMRTFYDELDELNIDNGDMPFYMADAAGGGEKEKQELEALKESQEDALQSLREELKGYNAFRSERGKGPVSLEHFLTQAEAAREWLTRPDRVDLDGGEDGDEEKEEIGDSVIFRKKIWKNFQKFLVLIFLMKKLIRLIFSKIIFEILLLKSDLDMVST